MSERTAKDNEAVLRKMLQSSSAMRTMIVSKLSHVLVLIPGSWSAVKKVGCMRSRMSA